MDRYKILPMGPDDIRWFVSVLPMDISPRTKGIVGIKGNERIAGTMFFNAGPFSVEAHHIIHDPFILRHGWLDVMGQAAFGSGRQVVYSVVSEDNAKALRFDKKIGFVESGKIPDMYGKGVDGIVIYLLRKDYPYLEENRHESEVS